MSFVTVRFRHIGRVPYCSRRFASLVMASRSETAGRWHGVCRDGGIVFEHPFEYNPSTTSWSPSLCTREAD
ncbi:MAG: hypothetical protein PUC29_06740 [Clostridia bacterium]|nr:hypothetical protein [Clostridia bacterium]